jgi:hypothetical protein
VDGPAVEVSQGGAHFSVRPDKSSAFCAMPQARFRCAHANPATVDGLACESTSQPAKKDYAPDALAVEALFVLT